MTVKVPKSDLYALPPGHLILQLAGAGSAFHLPPSHPPEPKDTVGASFYLYLPTSHPVAQRGKGIEPTRIPSQPYPLLVLAHGSGRDAESIRRRWKEWAEARDVVLLAPLFPIDDRVPDGVDNYKRMRYDTSNGQVRYDHLLLDAILYVEQRWGFVQTARFGMVGFSGGGQFSHRFMYLHPEKLWAVSIGAPGQATFLDSAPWPKGVGDTDRVLGQAILPESFAAVPKQLIVGTKDTLARQGEKMTRFDVIQKLRDQYLSLGVELEWVAVEGAGHDERQVIKDVMEFVDRNLPRAAKGL